MIKSRQAVQARAREFVRLAEVRRGKLCKCSYACAYVADQDYSQSASNEASPELLATRIIGSSAP